VIRETRTGPVVECLGRGIDIEAAGSGTFSRLLVRESVGAGVFAIGADSSLRLTDFEIRDTESCPVTGVAGRGLETQVASSLTRGRLAANRGSAVFIHEADVAVSHLRVEDTLPHGCAMTTCPEYPAGHGVTVRSDATAIISDFVLTRSSLCGVMLAEGGELDLVDGRISEAAIGACVQVDGYDTSRLTEGVDYVDNGINLQATMLPVPEPTAPLGG
jgi:hypothetical protein